MFLLESPHRGDSNEYTQYTIFYIKKKITLNHPKLSVMRFFSQGTQERVRNSGGKRAIGVRATEVLLYFDPNTQETMKTQVYQSDVSSFRPLHEKKKTPRTLTVTEGFTCIS